MSSTKNNYKGFAKLDRLIAQSAKQHHFEQALYKHKLVKCWQEVAGAFVEEAKNLTQVMDLKKGVLTIACLSREVVFKLKTLATNIVLALNQLMGKQIVFALHFEY